MPHARSTAMNKILAALLLSAALTATLSTNLSAQTLAPAPVPNRDMGGVAPSDRAGRPDGSERAAPFSGLPNTMGAGTGQDTPATTGAVDTRSAPSPSLSR